jgi:hypothetical protein
MKIPGKELVRRNASLRENRYSDDYLLTLNQFMNVNEVFGEHKAEVARGGNVVGRLVMDTLGRSEYENHLVALVMAAAKTGEWSAVLRKPNIHEEGLDAVMEKRFGYVIEIEGKKFLLPSALYVSYCKAQLE